MKEARPSVGHVPAAPLGSTNNNTHEYIFVKLVKNECMLHGTIY